MRRTAATIFLLCLALYAPSMGRFFVSDDFLNMERNVLTELADVRAAFGTEEVDFYRPIPRLHFGVLHAVAGDRVFVWNLVGVLLHALCSLAVVRLALSLLGTGRERIAAWTGILFAVHFIHVEPVVWASGVTSLFVTLFLLEALTALRRSRASGRIRHLAGAAGWFALALLSKETAVAFLLLAPLTMLVWPVPSGGVRRFGWIREAIPFLLILVVYLAIVSTVDRGGSASPYQWIPGAHVARNAAFFLLGGVAPVRFWEVRDVLASSTGGGMATLLRSATTGIPMVLAGGGIAYAIVRGGRDVRGAFAWVLVAAAPFLLLPGSGERFLYLSSFGACLALALGGAWLVRFGRGPVWAGAALVMLAFVWGNLDRQRDWVLASRWTQSIVESGQGPVLPASTHSVEFSGIPGEVRSAWVFRNGFESMARLYWGRDRVFRSEDRGGRSVPAHRVQVECGTNGTVVFQDSGGAVLDRGNAVSL